MGIAFVPLYIQYLGMEAFGLIGVFAILQASFAVLDFGMTPTLNREMARYMAGAHSVQSIRDLLRSLEIICFGTAFLIAAVIYGSATWLATHWLKAEVLSINIVAEAMVMMGFVVALRFVEGLYRGAIIGLQKQVWLSAVSALLATIRGGGAAFVLIQIKSDIGTFFIWQFIISAVSLFVVIFAVYRALPASLNRARFSIIQLKQIQRFASAMMATSILSLLLMQVDKVILSRVLSLEMFGYYSLAGTVASILTMLMVPIYQAYFPRFTQLVTLEDNVGVARSYHQGAQLMSVFVIPAALVLIFFGENILLLWTGKASLAHNVAPLLALLAFGTMLNGLMHIPYMLTLAYGWPGFAVRQNIIAVIILVPAVLWATPRYGAIGAAWIWLILNSAYLLIGMHFIHRRLLHSEKWSWYWNDVSLPLISAVIVGTAFWKMQPESMSTLTSWLWILAAGIAMSASAALAAPLLRKQFFEIIIK